MQKRKLTWACFELVVHLLNSLFLFTRACSIRLEKYGTFTGRSITQCILELKMPWFQPTLAYRTTKRTSIWDTNSTISCSQTYMATKTTQNCTYFSFLYFFNIFSVLSLVWDGSIQYKCILTVKKDYNCKIQLSLRNLFWLISREKEKYCMKNEELILVLEVLNSL